MSVLVVGSLALDSIETPFGAVHDAIGGSATYISAAASYFVKPIRLVGVVGGDFPKAGMAFLEERNVDLDTPRRWGPVLPFPSHMPLPNGLAGSCDFPDNSSRGK